MAAGCSRQSDPKEPPIRTTNAYAEIFGDPPRVEAAGPCFAAVAYFPSGREPGKIRPVPIFSTDRGEEERFAVRTVIRGIRAPKEFPIGITPPFPEGCDLESLAVGDGVAKIVVSGSFRAAGFDPGRGKEAARALARTIAQFGRAREVDVSDMEGTAHFRGSADEGAVEDVGPPAILGLVAAREKPAGRISSLSVLFDRPVTVEEIAFFPHGGKEPAAGKVYATGFGMIAEFRPDGPSALAAAGPWRIRASVRDGKGRPTVQDRSWTPVERDIPQDGRS